MPSASSSSITTTRAAFGSNQPIFWVIGGACSGKSTVCQTVASQHDVTLIDMDARVYGRFIGRYDPLRHPASTAWLAAPNPLDYLLSMTWEDFNAHNRAAQLECLDLLGAELVERGAGGPLLVDGGITHPALLAQIVAAETIICLDAPDAVRVREWESAEDRAEMRDWIDALPNSQTKWQTFMRFDHRMTATIRRECREAGIKQIRRTEHTTVTELAQQVAAHFDLEGDPDNPQQFYKTV